MEFLKKIGQMEDWDQQKELVYPICKDSLKNTLGFIPYLFIHQYMLTNFMGVKTKTGVDKKQNSNWIPVVLVAVQKHLC